jgi:hypothetical protein
MALGDFSPSAMPKLLVSLDDATTDSRVQQRQDLMPELGIIEMIKNIETANWNSVRPADRYCEEFDVAWLEESDTEAVVATGQTMIHRPLCTIDGEELQSVKTSYKIDKTVTSTLKVKDEDCGNMYDWNSKVQLGLKQSFKKLLVGLAQALPAYVDAYSGDNQLNTAGWNGQAWNIGSANGAFTEIEPSDLTANKVIPYLTMLAQMNKLQSPGIVDGGLLFMDYWNAQAQAGTGAGDIGNANFWALWKNRYELDVVNMAAAGYLNAAFVIDQGALALPIVSFFPRLGSGENEVVANKYIYSVPIPGYTLGGNPVYVDITYTRAEEAIAGGSGRCQIVHTFHMQLKFNLWRAPKYTSDTTTGIVTLKAGAAV